MDEEEGDEAEPEVVPWYDELAASVASPVDDQGEPIYVEDLDQRMVNEVVRQIKASIAAAAPISVEAEAEAEPEGEAPAEVTVAEGAVEANAEEEDAAPASEAEADAERANSVAADVEVEEGITPLRVVYFTLLLLFPLCLVLCVVQYFCLARDGEDEDDTEMAVRRRKRKQSLAKADSMASVVSSYTAAGRAEAGRAASVGARVARAHPAYAPGAGQKITMAV